MSSITSVLPMPDAARAARLTKLAEVITADPVLLAQYRNEILTIIAVAHPAWPSHTFDQFALGAFEEFRSAWEQLDDYHEGRLTYSQIDPDASGLDIEATIGNLVGQEAEEALRLITRPAPARKAA